MEQVLVDRARAVNQLLRKTKAGRLVELKKSIYTVDDGERRMWEVWVVEAWEHTHTGSQAMAESLLYKTQYMSEIEGFLNAMVTLRETPDAIGLTLPALPEPCHACACAEKPAPKKKAAKKAAKKKSKR
jgi:hypothetical protein